MPWLADSPAVALESLEKGVIPVRIQDQTGDLQVPELLDMAAAEHNRRLVEGQRCVDLPGADFHDAKIGPQQGKFRDKKGSVRTRFVGNQDNWIRFHTRTSRHEGATTQLPVRHEREVRVLQA